MKIWKRVLIGLLAVAVLVSGLLVYSFADEILGPGEGDAVTPDEPSDEVIPDFADVLKYYDPEYSFLYDYEDYEDGEYDQSILTFENAAGLTKAEVKTVSGNSYLSITLGHILDPDARTNAAYSIALSENAISKVLINASISGSHEAMSGLVCPACGDTFEDLNKTLCQKCGAALELVSSEAPAAGIYVSDESGLGVALVKLDFKTGKVSYYNGSEYAIADGFTATEGKWYDISVTYNASGYEFSVTDGENTYIATDVNSPVFALKTVSVGCAYVDDNRGCTVNVDNVFVQGGLDNRTVGVDVAAKTAEGLELLVSMLGGDYSTETKLAVVGVYDELVGKYGDAIVRNEDVDRIFAELDVELLNFFSSELNKANAAINKSAKYAVRLQHIEANQYYADRVAALLEKLSSTDCEAMLSVFNAEKDTLAALDSESLRFGSYIRGVIATNVAVFSSEDYNELKTLVEGVEADYMVDGVYTFDPTHPDLTDVYSTYASASTKYYRYLESSKIFCENVAIAAAAEDPDANLSDVEFKACLDAYDIARDLNFENATFPGMADALVVYRNLVSLGEISRVAELFIDYIATAEQAIYIFMKEEWLDLAAEYIDAEANTPNPYYPGVTEALAKYDALRESVNAKKAAADAYIAAVNNIDGKTGDALISAINAALALREEGNVLGYDGVTEANIRLDNANSSEALKNAYAAKFITLVGEIDNSASLEVRFAAIKAARDAEANADVSIAGVSAAKATLRDAINAYSADINAVNSSYSEVAENAGVISGAATSLSDIIKIVVSAIKAIVA